VEPGTFVPGGACLSFNANLKASATGARKHKGYTKNFCLLTKYKTTGHVNSERFTIYISPFTVTALPFLVSSFFLAPALKPFTK
jgi:hypothetical protein